MFQCQFGRKKSAIYRRAKTASLASLRMLDCPCDVKKELCFAADMHNVHLMDKVSLSNTSQFLNKISENHFDWNSCIGSSDFLFVIVLPQKLMCGNGIGNIIRLLYQFTEITFQRWVQWFPTTSSEAGWPKTRHGYSHCVICYLHREVYNRTVWLVWMCC